MILGGGRSTSLIISQQENNIGPLVRLNVFRHLYRFVRIAGGKQDKKHYQWRYKPGFIHEFVAVVTQLFLPNPIYF